MLGALEVQLDQREAAAIVGITAASRVVSATVSSGRLPSPVPSRRQVVEAGAADVEHAERRLARLRRQRGRRRPPPGAGRFSATFSRSRSRTARPGSKAITLPVGPTRVGGDQREQTDVGAAVDEHVAGGEQAADEVDVGVVVAVPIQT